MIPFNAWQPLFLAELDFLFENAPFNWCLAGGFAMEQCVGFSFREPADIDVEVFREDQSALQ